jgi:hypothetical protein
LPSSSSPRVDRRSCSCSTTCRADSASLRLLDFLAVELQHGAITIVGTCRSGVRREPLERARDALRALQELTIESVDLMGLVDRIWQLHDNLTPRRRRLRRISRELRLPAGHRRRQARAGSRFSLFGSGRRSRSG